MEDDDPIEYYDKPALYAVTSKNKKTLLRLAEHWDPDVRIYVAQNPNTGEVALRLLEQDSDFRIHQAAIKHPSFPLDRLLVLTKTSGLAQKVLSERSMLDELLGE